MFVAALLLAPVLAAGTTFACTPTRVWDGDGPIWCAEGPRVRLAGIAAREIDESCKPGHPCPSASGVVARDALVRLLGGPRGEAPTGHILVQGPILRCASNGSAGGTRTAAFCRAKGIGDVSCAMLATRMVVRWSRYWGGHHCE